MKLTQQNDNANWVMTTQGATRMRHKTSPQMAFAYNSREMLLAIEATKRMLDDDPFGWIIQRANDAVAYAEQLELMHCRANGVIEVRPEPFGKVKQSIAKLAEMFESFKPLLEDAKAVCDDLAQIHAQSYAQPPSFENWWKNIGLQGVKPTRKGARHEHARNY